MAESVAELNDLRVDVRARNPYFGIILLSSDPDARYRLRVPVFIFTSQKGRRKKKDKTKTITSK